MTRTFRMGLILLTLAAIAAATARGDAQQARTAEWVDDEAPQSTSWTRDVRPASHQANKKATSARRASATRRYVEDESAPMEMTIDGEGMFDGTSTDGSWDGCNEYGGCSDCFSGMGGRGRCGWYARGEYLLWWIDEMTTPALATSSPNGTAQNVAGVLGAPSTSILFGGELDMQSRSGGKVTVGYWIPCRDASIEGSYLFIGDDTDGFSRSSTGNPALARPFFNATTGQNDASLVGFTSLVNGSLNIDVSTEFESGEILVRRPICDRCDLRWDFLFGYRYGSLDDELSISHSTLDVTTGATAGSRLQINDRFDTENRFHGAQIGASATMRRCQWSLELVAKIALGNAHSEVSVSGSSVATDASNVSVSSAEGLLVQSTNRGVYSHDTFSAMPELGVTLAYDVSECWRATLGYHLIYWGSVARSGDQIDTDLNLSNPLVGTPVPRFDLSTTDFWAQGLNIGLERRF